jgi:hypothetical protein
MVCPDCEDDCYIGPNRLCDHANESGSHYEDCETCDGPICPQCNGSGEGMHDGTKCKSCKGYGIG